MASISPDKHLAVLSLPRGDTSPTGRERVPPPGPAPRDQRAAGWPAAGAPQVGGTTLRLAAAGGGLGSLCLNILPNCPPAQFSHFTNTALPPPTDLGRGERGERRGETTNLSLRKNSIKIKGGWLHSFSASKYIFF